MDAYGRCTNLGKKIMPILLISMVKAENFSDNPRRGVFCRSYEESLQGRDNGAGTSLE
jgi:hypothetical protein